MTFFYNSVTIALTFREATMSTDSRKIPNRQQSTATRGRGSGLLPPPDAFPIAQAAAGAFWGTLAGGALGLGLSVVATAVADLAPVISIGAAPLTTATTTLATGLGAALGGLAGGWVAPRPVTKRIRRR